MNAPLVPPIQEDAVYRRQLRGALIAAMRRRLTRRQIAVLRARFGRAQLTYAALARELGISTGRAQQIERMALAKLRRGALLAFRPGPCR